MSAALRKYTTSLAVLALLLAQFAGLPGGWMCSCAGSPVIVTESVCTGEHCHEGHSHGDDDHEHHSHQEFRECLQTVTVATEQFSPPLLIEWTLPFTADSGVRFAEACVELASEEYPWLDDPGGGVENKYARRTAVMLI
jgi:hypothetical protein